MPCDTVRDASAFTHPAGRVHVSHPHRAASTWHTPASCPQGFVLVKTTSSVTTAMIGNLKIVIVIVFAAIIMGSETEPINIVGYVLTVLAACGYTTVNLAESGKLKLGLAPPPQPDDRSAKGGTRTGTPSSDRTAGV